MAETADHFSLKIFAVSRLGRRYSWITDVVDCPGEQRVKRRVVDSVSGRREAVRPVLARIESSDKILHDSKWICQVPRGEGLALNPTERHPALPTADSWGALTGSQRQELEVHDREFLTEPRPPGDPATSGIRAPRSGRPL